MSSNCVVWGGGSSQCPSHYSNIWRLLRSWTPNSKSLLLKWKPILPPRLSSKQDSYSRGRWKQVQYLSDLFWKRWTQEYLPLMQERQNGMRSKLLIIDETSPRNSWPMGLIMETFPDAKGFVRCVKVKTQTNILERLIIKLCLLKDMSWLTILLTQLTHWQTPHYTANKHNIYFDKILKPTEILYTRVYLTFWMSKEYIWICWILTCWCLWKWKIKWYDFEKEYWMDYRKDYSLDYSLRKNSEFPLYKG